MSDQQQATTDAENIQNSQTVEESTSQNEQQQPYKSFTEDEWKSFMDSTIKRSYNEGKQKFVKDATKELGLEVEDYDGALNKLRDIVSGTNKNEQEQEQQSSSEVEQLRALLKQKEEEAQKAQETLSKVRQDQLKSQQYNNALSELNKAGKLSLDEESTRILFENAYDIREENGQMYAFQGDIPVMDESGNRKTLSQAYTDFVKSKKLFQPNAQGTGGGTGGGASVSGGKPKFSEFSELTNSKKSGDRAKAAELWNLSKEIGWDDKDSPKTFRRA